MAYKYNQLAVPFCHWSGEVPAHKITCSTFAGENEIVTGSHSGFLCIWSWQADALQLTARVLLVGHKAPITALCYEEIYGNPCIISVSEDGTMCVWDSTDGLCLRSSENLLAKYAPTHLTPIGDRRRVAVSGRYHKVAIVDVTRMKIEEAVASHAHWVDGVFPCTMQLSESEHVFLTLSGKILRYWALTEERTLDAIQTIMLDIDNPRQIIVCPTNTTFVALSDEYWYLFAAANSRCLHQVRCPYVEEGSKWTGGEYIDTHHVLLWTEHGQACLYRLPAVSHLTPMDFGHGARRAPQAPAPHLLEPALLYTLDLQWNSDLSVRTRLLGSEVVGCCSAGREYLCLADERGALNLFALPLSELARSVVLSPGEGEGEEEEEEPPAQPSTQAILPLTWGRFSDCWMLEDGRVPSRSHAPVTASCILPKSLILLLGHEDGGVTIQQLPHDPRPRHMPHCHHGKITALMNASSSDYPNLLFTGGDDCRIHMWDLDTGDWLRTWTHHSGSIQHLVALPSQADGMPGEGCFLSVSSDHSVGLFSFDPPRPKPLKMFTGHQAPVRSVQMRADQDYLFVLCKDSTVTVWELSTGEFEGCYPASYLQEITDMTMTELSFSRHRPRGDIRSESQSTVTLFSYDRLPKRPCANVLLLNVRHLLEESYNRHTCQVLNVAEVVRLYSFLVPWGLDGELDQLTERVGARPPAGLVSTGLCGENDFFSLFLPSHGQITSATRMQISQRASAVHLLAGFALTRMLLQISPEEEDKNTLSKIVTYYFTLLPERIPHQVPPSLGFLTNFWRDKRYDLQQAAHSIFLATFERQTADEREVFLQEWVGRMERGTRHALKSKAIPCLVLGIIGSSRPKAIRAAAEKMKDLPARIAQSLSVLVLSHPQISYQILAAEVLAKGFSLWGQYITEGPELIQHLLSLKTPAPAGKLSPSQKALLELSVQIPAQFVQTVSELSKLKAFPVGEYLTALRVTAKLIKKSPFAFIEDFPTMVEYVVRSISPKYATRSACLNVSNAILLGMVSIYPMIAYDSDTQRYAVGTIDKHVVIYDLKTCARLHTLSGHNSMISALSFSADGKTLASFAQQERLVRFWSCGSSGLWFNSPPRCLKGLLVQDQLNWDLPVPRFLTTLKMEWVGHHRVKITQGNNVTTLQFS